MDSDAVAAIIEHLSPSLRRRLKTDPPLFVALQGPQGSGKSFIAALLKARLSASPHSLNVTIISIDDLYLPHADLTQLARQHPENPLWSGRGQPGTHDVDLGLRLLQTLRSQEESVELPRFDKSLFDGQGDRLPLGLQDSTISQPPLDLVILEGCVWIEERERLDLTVTPRKADLESVNNALLAYVKLWSGFDIFVQIKPSPSQVLPSKYSIIYQWRLEQEHYMKASNGGRGMSDDAVKGFVDRYIPGYVFFGDIPVSSSPWSGLRLLVDETRCLVGIEKF
ncbi:P-loop containing nucleoside triphosphate hydrolase protein [Collybia nuda]|uniref:P-loop containing nucleoside triphosphate hydrolase protein n=1 Tax=Collybia nuda TaxID=64659 RepID=A0A9P5YJ18_9AGAR|nr:P-loop containing nucleoside triphosphate hydrolase protein [Collybia nuda]